METPVAPSVFESEWPALAAGMFALVVGLILSFAVRG
jgi:hypothetical protein